MGLVKRSRRPAVEDFDAALTTVVRREYFKVVRSATHTEFDSTLHSIARPALRLALRKIIADAGTTARVDLRNRLISFGGTIAERGDVIEELIYRTRLAEKQSVADVLRSVLDQIGGSPNPRFLTTDDIRALARALDAVDAERRITEAAYRLTESGLSPEWHAEYHAILREMGEDHAEAYLKMLNSRYVEHQVSERAHRRGGRPSKSVKGNGHRANVYAPPGAIATLKKHRVAYGDALGLVADLLNEGHTMDTIRDACTRPVASTEDP